MIQVVIDIPKEIYQDILKNGFIYDEDNEVITHAIKNGTSHETVTEFADRCRECGRERVLDMIRAEIDAHREKLKIMADDDWYAGKIRGYDCAIEIIDKYKVESEDKHG